MARKNPSDTRSLREKIDKGIHTAPGEAIGGLIEKAILRGKPATGTHTATQTGAKQRAKKRATDSMYQGMRIMDSARKGTEEFEKKIKGNY